MMPGQALLSLLGTLPGAMISGTLSLQGTTSLQVSSAERGPEQERTRGLRDCARAQTMKYEK